MYATYVHVNQKSEFKYLPEWKKRGEWRSWWRNIELSRGKKSYVTTKPKSLLSCQLKSLKISENKEIFWINYVSHIVYKSLFSSTAILMQFCSNKSLGVLFFLQASSQPANKIQKKIDIQGVGVAKWRSHLQKTKNKS